MGRVGVCRIYMEVMQALEQTPALMPLQGQQQWCLCQCCAFRVRLVLTRLCRAPLGT